MPSWKKVIISGSDAHLNSLNITSALTASGNIYPTTTGSDGQVITTDGNGNLSFEYVQDVYVPIKNVSGGELVKGTPVHATSSVSAGNSTPVIAASASDATTMPATFVLNETLANDEEGIALLSGYIQGIDTSLYEIGEVIYVGENGGFTNQKPQGSDNLIQNLGIVTKVHASNGSGWVYGSGRSNDVPNLPEGKIWVGSDAYSVTSSIVHLDEANGEAQFTGSVDITGSLEATGSVGFTHSSPEILASFSAGGNLNTGVCNHGGSGTQTAALSFGGSPAAPTSVTEEYNGTSWTNVNPLNNPRRCIAGAGTQTATVAFGGDSVFNSPTYQKSCCTEEYDGTSWTTGGALNTGRRSLSAAGTLNAALAFGGQTPSVVACTEEYNGTSWTTGNALNTLRHEAAGTGTQNAGLAIGGTPSGLPSNSLTSTEQYDGTSWSNTYSNFKYR